MYTHKHTHMYTHTTHTHTHNTYKALLILRSAS